MILLSSCFREGFEMWDLYTKMVVIKAQRHFRCKINRTAPERHKHMKMGRSISGKWICTEGEIYQKAKEVSCKSKCSLGSTHQKPEVKPPEKLWWWLPSQIIEVYMLQNAGGSSTLKRFWNQSKCLSTVNWKGRIRWTLLLN